MRSTSADLVNFFHQLSLLTKAQMPLPESVGTLGSSYRQGRLKTAVAEIAQDLHNGKSIADALRRHPDLFAAHQIQLLSVGERTGALPEVLWEVARSARLNLKLLTQTRELMIYPAIVVFVALTVTLVLMSCIVPQFAIIFSEMLCGEALPALTAFILAISNFVLERVVLTAVIYATILVVLAWAFSDRFGGQWFFRHALCRLPGSQAIVRLRDMARICSMGHVYLQRDTPLPEALEQVAELLETTCTRDALRSVAAGVREGRSPADEMDRRRRFDPLLTLVFRHCPEGRLGSELQHLANVYDEQARLAERRVVALWHVAFVVAMAVVVGFVVLAMFLPLISLVEKLGG